MAHLLTIGLILQFVIQLWLVATMRRAMPFSGSCSISGVSREELEESLQWQQAASNRSMSVLGEGCHTQILLMQEDQIVKRLATGRQSNAREFSRN